MRLLTCIILLCFCHVGGAGGIRLDSERRTYFADQPATFTVNVSGEARKASRLTIRLAHSQRTLWQTSRTMADSISVDCPMPPLEAGVILPVELHLVAEDERHTVVESMILPLFVFAKDQTSNQQAALTELGISVYAPGAESLSDQLAECGLPVTSVRQLDGVAGSWLICAGLNFDRRPSLLSDLTEVAKSGTNVLILPPILGASSWKSADYERLLFASATHLKEVDKRLDTRDWSNAAPTIAAFPDLTTRRSALMLSFSEEPAPWVWVEASAGDGKLIICGFDIASHLTENPSAIWLLLSLLTPPLSKETTP